MTDTLATLGFRADTSELRRAEQDLNRISKAGGETERSMISMSRAVTAVTAAFAAFGVGRAILQVADFSQAIADLSAITGAAGADLEYYRKQAQEIGRTTSLSASQAAEAFKLIASAKPDLLSSAEALNAVTREAVTLAEAAGITLPEAAQALGSTMNQFGLEAGKANEVINILAASSKFGTASVASVTEAMRNAGAAANSLGIDVAETVAGIQALAAAGREGADAGTALRQVMLRLESTGDQTLMPSLVGLNDALLELKTRNLDNTQLMQLFGQEAFTAAASLLAQTGTVTRLNTELRGTNTATEQATTRMNTLTGDLKAMGSAIEGLKIAVLGDEVEGLGRDLVRLATSGINSVTQNLGALADTMETMAKIAGVVLAGGMAGAAQATYLKIKADIEATASTNALIIAEKSRAVAAAQAAAQDAALSKSKQANNIANLSSALQQITAEQQLEAVRIRAQISEIGRIKTATRMAELGKTRAIFTAQLTAAETALAAAEGRSAAASATLTAATAGLTKAQAAATATSRALGAAVAFMTGPWGILIATIAASVAIFAASKKSSDDLTSSLGDQSAEIAKLANEYQRYSNARFSQEHAAAQREAIDLDMREMEIKTRLAQIEYDYIDAVNGRVQSSAAERRESAILRQELEALGMTKQEIETRLAAMKKAYDDGLESKVKWTDATKQEGEANSELDDIYKNSQDALEKMTKSLAAQTLQLTMSREDFELWALQIEAANNGVLPEHVKQLINMMKGYQAVRAEQERMANASKALDGILDGGLFGFGDVDTSELDSLIDRVNDFGGAWNAAGSAMIGAFGGIADALGDYSKRMTSLIELQAKLTAEKANYAVGSEEAARADIALSKVQGEMTLANLNGMSRAAGAAASLFKEQSKERKALHNAEKVFATIEIALALQKASANAMTAISAAFTAPPPLGFAMGAAMIGIMSGLGLFGGGSSGSAPVTNDGTGTSLGSDEASNSISASADEYKDIALDQLVELRKIRDSMQGLTNGIAQLAKSLIVGGQLGGAGVELTDKSFLDSGIGGFLRKADPVARIMDVLGLGGLADSIFKGFRSTKQKILDTGLQFGAQELGDVLSVGFEGFYFTVIETTKKKLWGLSKKTSTDTQTQAIDDAILMQITSIFGFLADAVSGAVDVLGVDMVNTLESFNIELGKISFEGLSGEDIQKKLEQVISAQGDLMAEYVLPQIKQYQQIGEGALETLLRVAKEQAVFNDALDMIGQNLGDLSNLMRIDVAQSIITMMGGLEAFNDAVGVYFKEFFSETEQLDYLTKSLTEAMAGLGYELPATREGFRALVDGLDLTTEAGQAAFAALMELVPGMAEYFKQIEKQTGAFTDFEGAAKGAFEMLKRSVQVEKDRAQEALSAARDVYNAEVERINGVKRAIEQVYETLMSNLSSAGALLNRSLAAESQRIESQYSGLQNNLSNAETAVKASFDAERNAILSSAEMQKQAIQQAADERMNALSAEAAMARQVANDLKRVQEQFSINTVTIEQALRAARGGDFSLAQQLQVSNVSSAGFSSAEEFAAAQAVQAGRLNEIGQLAGSRASAAERTAQAAEMQIEATKAAAASQIAAIDKAADEQIKQLDKQLNELLGISTTVLPLADAIEAYQKAKEELDKFDINTQREQLAEQQRQADLLMGIDNSVVSVEDALNAYRDAQLALDEFGYETQIEKLDLQLKTARSLLSVAEQAYTDEIARLDALLADSEQQLNALLGIDTSIKSLADAVYGFNAAISNLANSMRPPAPPPAPVSEQNSELQEQLKQERELNAAALKAIAKSSERTAVILQRIEFENAMSVQQ